MTTRLRTRGSFVTETKDASGTWNVNGNSYPHTGTVVTPFGGTVETISDVVIPNYAARSARGEVFINPMKSVKVTKEHEGSAALGWIKSSTSESDGNSPGGYYNLKALASAGISLDDSSNPESSMLNLWTLAGTQAQAGIKDPLFNGGVFLGELRETLQMLRNPLRSYHRLVKQAHRDKYKKLGKRKAQLVNTGRFISDNWLAYRFGVRPIISDVEDAIKAVHSLKEKQPLRQTSRGYASDSTSNSGSGSIAQWQSNVVYDSSVTHDVSVRAGVLYESNSHLDTFGMSPRELPLVIWELIPYSFVADWFVNVGTYIDAITPVMGVKVLGSWTTTKTSTVSVITCSREYLGLYATTSGGEASMSKSTVITHRVPGLKVGLASKISPYGGDYGKGRIIDSLALIEQALRKR